MVTDADILDMLHDFGTRCQIVEKDGTRRSVFMILRAVGGHAGTSVLNFVDKASLPPGADWAYGLLAAQDAPAGMTAETRLTIADSKGALWRVEAAKPMDAIENGIARVIAWRLALRGKQRGPGGK